MQRKSTSEPRKRSDVMNGSSLWNWLEKSAPLCNNLKLSPKVFHGVDLSCKTLRHLNSREKRLTIATTNNTVDREFHTVKNRRKFNVSFPRQKRRARSLFQNTRLPSLFMCRESRSFQKSRNTSGASMRWWIKIALATREKLLEIVSVLHWKRKPKV